MQRDIPRMQNPSAAPAVKRAKFLVGGVLLCLIIGGIIIFVVRAFHSTALAASTELHAKQFVTTILPKPAGKGVPLTLPGTLQAMPEGVFEATLGNRFPRLIVVVAWHCTHQAS